MLQTLKDGSIDNVIKGDAAASKRVASPI